MKVILWMAMSINGFIARENGEEDFLSHDNWTEFVNFSNKIGVIIWGRKTYEVVKTWEKSYLDDLANVKIVVLSSNQNYKVDDNVILATSPRDALVKLEKLGKKEVILTGGSGNNASFVKEGYLDELIIDIDSVLVGQGIPLFAPADFEFKLKLLEIKKLSEQTIQLHYQVVKS